MADEKNVDLDGDGYKESVVSDQSGDGHYDTVVSDTDGDGTYDTVAMDTTGDGNVDTVGVDSTGDGNVDTVVADTSGDGYADTVVVDTDGDGDNYRNGNGPDHQPESIGKTCRKLFRGSKRTGDFSITLVLIFHIDRRDHHRQRLRGGRRLALCRS